MDKYYPLHISPFIIVEKTPRSSYDKLPAFLKYGRHSKFGTIYGLSLPDLPINWSDLFNHIIYFLYAKLTELGAE